MDFRNLNLKISASESTAGSEESSPLRVFCAIEIPLHIRASVSQHIIGLQNALSPPSRKARWEREEKLHITLKFFGEVERSRISSLTDAITRAASDVPAFELQLEESGVFPPRGSPRVLWLGASDASGELTRLQNRLEDECTHENFKRETRPFHPHLTIARLDRMHAAEARQLAQLHVEKKFSADRFAVNEIVLMVSKLTTDGSQYKSLGRVELS